MGLSWLTPQKDLRILANRAGAIRHPRSLAANHATQRTAPRSSLKGTVRNVALLRTKMNELNGQRDERTCHLQILNTDLPELRQTLSKQWAATAATTLKRRLRVQPWPLGVGTRFCTATAHRTG